MLWCVSEHGEERRWWMGRTDEVRQHLLRADDECEEEQEFDRFIDLGRFWLGRASCG